MLFFNEVNQRHLLNFLLRRLNSFGNIIYSFFFSLLFQYIARHFLHKLLFISVLVSTIGMDGFCGLGYLKKIIKLHFVKITASTAI